LKKTKRNLLFIHNKGTLGEICKYSLGKYFSIKSILIKKEKTTTQLKRIIERQIKKSNIELLVYISGETKDERLMMKLNFELPFQIANLCNKNSIPLVYLSSLSIYGIPKTNLITNSSQRRPINLYGISKYSFDKILGKDFPKLKFCTLIPGSIINPNSSKSNLIKKALEQIQRKPLKWLLMIISPSGSYSCIHIDDLKICLVKECLNIVSSNDRNLYQIFKICSTKINFYDLVTYLNGRKPLFKLKSISIKLINYFSIFFPKTFKMKLIVYFANINYESDYDFLKERNICEYINNYTFSKNP
tara:strand:- start:4823 stop:5731 length:909 start_codon:yes stop_codon:yes gene_type:complete